MTHSHFDHIGVCGDIIRLMEDLGHPPPVIMKWMVPTWFYQYVQLYEPRIDDYVLNIRDGDKIRVDIDATITAIETPGHTEDHLCFLLKIDN